MNQVCKDQFYGELCCLVQTPRAQMRARVAEVMATGLSARAAWLFLFDYTGTSLFCAAHHDVSTSRGGDAGLRITVDVMRAPCLMPALVQKKTRILSGTAQQLGISIRGLADEAEVGLVPLFRPENQSFFGLAIIQGAPDAVMGRDHLAASRFLEAVGSVLSAALKCNELEIRVDELIKHQEGKELLGTAWRHNPTEKINHLFPGSSHPIEALRGHLIRQATLTRPLLLLGARGTRKEEAAGVLHQASTFRNGSLVHVDCAQFGGEDFRRRLFGVRAMGSGRQAAAAAGFLREAQRGVLLLTNADQIPTAAQRGLLHLLERGKYRQEGGNHELDFTGRIILTTDASLAGFKDWVEQGLLDPVLHSVLTANKVVFVGLDPLGPDFDLTVQAYLNQIARDRRGDLKMSLEALALLASLEFPGHYRQLNAILQGAAEFLEPGEGVIRPRHLAPMISAEVTETAPSVAGDRPNLKDQLETFERSVIERALYAQGGNRADAAAILGIPKRTLADRCKKYSL
jgi:sigma-54-specific transcriptional regulator